MLEDTPYILIRVEISNATKINEQVSSMPMQECAVREIVPTIDHNANLKTDGWSRLSCNLTDVFKWV